MMLSIPDHGRCLRACADPRTTVEEREFLGYVASLVAVREHVQPAEYGRMERLLGGHLSVEGSIFNRDVVTPAG